MINVNILTEMMYYRYDQSFIHFPRPFLPSSVITLQKLASVISMPIFVLNYKCPYMKILSICNIILLCMVQIWHTNMAVHICFSVSPPPPNAAWLLACL